MPTEIDTTKQQPSYRIISWNTAQACRLILEEAKTWIDRCGYKASSFEWPVDRNAIEWLTNLPILKNREWPLVVEVGSHEDTTFSSILESTNAWLSESASVGLNTSLAVFLRPFLVFQSCYLTSGFEGLISNRNLIALCENTKKHVVSSTDYNPEAETAFKELLLTARWVCDDPEKRLYKTPSGSASS